MSAESEEGSAARPHRPIRSFVRREGRMTPAQTEALARLWPIYGLERGAAPYDWAAVFGRRARVSFEIGFGAGHALLHRAERDPDSDFVGCEVHRPGVGRVLHEADRRGLRNLRLIAEDAVEVLREAVAAASLDEVIVEFPDPWHKKRHHKRRLVQTPFLDLVASRLKPGGDLRLATDWQPYAAWMLEVLQAHPAFENRSPSGAGVPRPDSRPVTRFEARGERLGHVVSDLHFRRR
ncbi:MAG TPA: tRNA (guanosine(46)-N7)-methyltransferase TrmB [Nevskiaceae bacterium]|nr:tRNA (guanosine(46)-N7)-methyltransferase TrmB [Nevskiaceae bacterium]